MLVTPYYQRGPVTLYCGRAEDIVPRFHRRGIVMTDTAYSAVVHEKATSRARRAPLRDGNGNRSPCSLSRTVDLGFEPLTPEFRCFCAEQAARLASRWAMFFCDAEGLAGWRDDLNAAGIPYRVHATWVKQCATPKFTGMESAVGDETIAIAHHDPDAKRGIPARFWNGGGKLGVYTCPIVNEAHGREGRVHETQKPERLMCELIADWTELGELIYDFTAGSGTTLVCAARLGRIAVGVEERESCCEIAARRLDAELSGWGGRVSKKSSQLGFFDLTSDTEALAAE